MFFTFALIDSLSRVCGPSVAIDNCNGKIDALARAFVSLPSSSMTGGSSVSVSLVSFFPQPV
jgi:hypothetical protein